MLAFLKLGGNRLTIQFDENSLKQLCCGLEQGYVHLKKTNNSSREVLTNDVIACL